MELAAWRADYRRLYARLLWQEGDASAARSQFLAALRAAPADASLWLEYEFFLALSAPLDPALPLVTERAAALGPNQPELRLSQADFAVRNWVQAAPALRRAWLGSLRYALAKDQDNFLVRTFRSAGEGNLCAEQSALKLQAWCAQAGKARMACARDSLSPAQWQWCRSMNAVPSSASGPRP